MPESLETRTVTRMFSAARPGFSSAVHRWRRSAVVGYAVAVVSAGLALYLTYVFREPFDRVIFVLFFLAVGIASWVGGLGPALLVIGIGMIGVNYFIFPPTRSLGLESSGQLYALLLFGAVGGVISWLAASQRRLSFDLTEQAQQLTRNRDFLAQAQSSAQLGSWEWDIAADRVTWSDQMFRIYGREPGSFDVKFDVFKGFVHPDDRELAQQTVANALRDKKPFSYDHRVIWPDGTVRWLHGRGRPIFDDNGQVIGMVGSGQDITERKNIADAERLLAEASEALADSLDYRKTLRTVASLAVRDVADWCSVAVGDETGRYENLAVAHRDPDRVKWVEEYSRLNPPRFDTPTGVPQVLRSGKPELYPEIDDKLLEAAASTEKERQVVRELGLYSAMVLPMIARGRVIGAISFISAESRRRYGPEDMSFAERLANRAAYAIDNARLFEEAVAARAEAESANAAKAQFLASMSHELRTPLNAIGGYAELIELGVLGPVTEKQQEALGRVRRSQRHLNFLVDQVLSFARIEAGKVHLEIVTVPVNDAVSRLADLIAPQAAGKQLKYEFDGCGPDIAVRADRDRLDQILLNLIGNAVKYTPSGGSIRVSVDCDPRTVSISVADTGPGIPEDQRDVIFRPFVQLGTTADRPAGGVGLGLAISRDLAHAMDGEVRVKRSSPAGSTFVLTLPRARNESGNGP